MTGFVQASIRDDQLAVDVALTALPAVEAGYRVADRSEPASPLLMFRMLGATLIDVGRRTPQAPLNLARTGVRRWQRRPGRSAERDLGARAGLRELAARHDPRPRRVTTRRPGR